MNRIKNLRVVNANRFGGRISGLIAFVITYFIACQPPFGLAAGSPLGNLLAALLGLWAYGVGKLFVEMKFPR